MIKRLKSVYNKIFTLYLGIGGLLVKRGYDFFAQQTMEFLSEHAGYPFYYGKYISLKELEEWPKYYVSNIAIVLQGSIVYKDNFTLGTIKLYRTLYPNIGIILSTWEKEVTTDFREEVKKYNIIILENKIPDYSGLFHTNFQIKSAHEGSKYCRINGFDYILKTRTDQRIYRNDFLLYLLNTHKAFPVESYGNLFGRIIFLATSFQFVPYNICDFMAFGYSKDIESLYDIPYEQLGENQFMKNKEKYTNLLLNERKLEKYSIRQINKDDLTDVYKTLKGIVIPEIYIIKSFIAKLNPGGEMKDEYTIYWDFLKRAAVIVDDRDLLLYWFKYNYRKLCDTNMFMHECGLDHARWLDLYINGYGHLD